MLTPQQAALRLDISLSLVYQLCKSLVLNHYRVGGRNKRGRIRIEESEVERYRQECRREARPPVPALKHVSLD